MELNALPTYDASDNSTGCCPRFNPEGWDDQKLHFKDRQFVRAKTKSVFHFPINMGSVFKKTFKAIDEVHAGNKQQFIVLSRDLSLWSSEHYFAVDSVVPGEEMASMTGDFRTKVFEGPYKDVPKWQATLEAELVSHGEKAEESYFFYTTCPKCAKVYGKNYVVAVARLAPSIN